MLCASGANDSKEGDPPYSTAVARGAYVNSCDVERSTHIEGPDIQSIVNSRGAHTLGLQKVGGGVEKKRTAQDLRRFWEDLRSKDRPVDASSPLLPRKIRPPKRQPLLEMLGGLRIPYLKSRRKFDGDLAWRSVEGAAAPLTIKKNSSTTAFDLRLRLSIVAQVCKHGIVDLRLEGLWSRAISNSFHHSASPPYTSYLHHKPSLCAVAILRGTPPLTWERSSIHTCQC